MRPDPTLWGLQAGRKPRDGLFGEPITAAIAGVALTLAFIAFPARLALAAIWELLP